MPANSSPKPGPLIEAEKVVVHRAAQVRVDDQGGLALLGEGQGRVRHGQGLALARPAAGDEQRLDGLVGAGEHDVGAQRAVGLGHHAFLALGPQHQLRVLVADLRLLALGDASA